MPKCLLSLRADALVCRELARVLAARTSQGSATMVQDFPHARDFTRACGVVSPALLVKKVMALVNQRRQRGVRISAIGFTLVEIVVALAVILILAAVALPSLTGALDQKRIDATASQLAIVRDALYNANLQNNQVAFFQSVGANAGRLSELDSIIISGNATYATGTDNSCGAAFSAGQRTNWIAAGPFMTFNSQRATGMMTPIGLAADSLTRIPNSANPGSLRLNFINDVDLTDAQLLDASVEAGNGWNAGVVQWTPQNGTNGIVTMYYFVTINNVC
jgi:prepilin-type N-terminal cleavage/methylation domain-containing protein